MKIFHWFLLCDVCETVFQPQEDDWDGDITCPQCESVGRICHGDEHEGTFVPDDLEPPPGAHPDWPENLSDEQLDAAWETRNLLPGNLQEMLRMEYDRRERTLPAKKIGLA